MDFTKTFDRGPGSDRRVGRETADDALAKVKRLAHRDFIIDALIDAKIRLAERVAEDPGRVRRATLEANQDVVELEVSLASV